MDRKKTIIFIVVFILVVLISIGIYSYFKNKNSGTLPSNPTLYDKFNPFGTGTTVAPKPGTTTTPEIPGITTVGQTSRFYQITNFGVSGGAFLLDSRPVPETTDPTTGEPITVLAPAVRYAERATGHIHEMFLDTKISGKISNSTIPSVHEVIFGSDAKSAIYRYLADDNSISSFLATLGGGSNFLTPDILDISVSPDKGSFFTLVKTKTGVAGITKSFLETKTKQVFISPFSEWLSQWPTDNSVYLTTKASYLVAGSAFSLDIASGTMTKILGGINGLTTLANYNGNLVLFGASLSRGPSLNIFDIKNHSSTDLAIYGLPEKCVWSRDNINIYCALPNTIMGTGYPDVWYQGLYSFIDYFVKINTKTRDISTLANSQNETPVDAIKPFLSNKEDKLFFTNKKDYTLWSLDL